MGKGRKSPDAETVSTVLQTDSEKRVMLIECLYQITDLVHAVARCDQEQAVSHLNSARSYLMQEIDALDKYAPNPAQIQAND